MVADWMGLMEPAGDKGCPSGQGRGRAAHGEVNVPSPDQKSFYICTIPTNPEPGTKTVIPRVDTAPHGVETPTQGPPLLIEVREASGPHPMGVRSPASS